LLGNIFYLKKSLQISLFFLIIFTYSCKKNRNHPVPNLPFDITININLPTYSALEGVGGWTYVSGGSKGIVVYRKSIDEFIAFDRHSPAKDGTCEKPLEVDSNNFLQLNDLCTSARFSLLDGSAMYGSEFGLRQYQTFWDGAFQLRIFN
jgi:hypothetical protein